MHFLPRKHYRDIARELIENPTPKTAEKAIQAINELLEDRSRLSHKILKKALETEVPAQVKKPWWKIFSKE